MVDEILSTFQEELFGQYDEILASDDDPRTKLERAVLVSFEAIDQHHDEVAIFQNDAAYLLHLRAVRLPRRAQPAVPRGLADPARRAASTPACCATTSTSSSPTASSATPSGSRSRWYRPGGRRTHTEIAQQYLTILLEGIHAMPEAFIVDAVRTPVGKRGGALAGVHSADLAAHTITALVDRTGVDPGAVDDVILGCCDTIGSQAGDVARTAWLVAGLPDHVPGVTIDRQCGSSQQAVHFAAQGVMSGTQDLVVAGGVQNMSAIPISAAMLVGQQYGFSTPFAESPGWQARYGDQEVSQFRSAEMIAEKWDISREEMEEFALASHERARTAIAEGRFDREIVARWATSTPTSARARRRWRRWPASSRWLPAAGSRRRSPRRSATRRRRC